MKNRFSNQPDDIYLETVRKRRKPSLDDVAPKIKRFKESLDPSSPRSRFSAFMRQEVGGDGFGFIPPEYTNITLFVLFVFLPKLLGMGFFYLYICKGQASLYATTHTDGFLFDWVVGYEIFATVLLLYIGRKLIQAVYG